MKIPFLILAFLLCICPSLRAEPVTQNGLTFDVLSAGLYSVPGVLPQTDALSTRISNTSPHYLAITFQIVNQNEALKVALSNGFSFVLSDEYGNSYRSIAVPDTYVRPVQFLNAHYPSLYPGDRYAQTVFFEPPVGVSKLLTFQVRDKTLLSGDGVVSLPIETAVIMSDINAVPVEQEVVYDWQEGIKILGPMDGVELSQGAHFRMKVQLDDHISVERLLIIGLGETFTDEHPGQTNIYDLNIPDDFPEGWITVSVVGSSPAMVESKHVLSDSIMLNVRPIVRPLFKADAATAVQTLDDLTAR